MAAVHSSEGSVLLRAVLGNAFLARYWFVVVPATAALVVSVASFARNVIKASTAKSAAWLALGAVLGHDAIQVTMHARQGTDRVVGCAMLSASVSCTAAALCRGAPRLVTGAAAAAPLIIGLLADGRPFAAQLVVGAFALVHWLDEPHAFGDIAKPCVAPANRRHGSRRVN